VDRLGEHLVLRQELAVEPLRHPLHEEGVDEAEFTPSAMLP
jgi:hypothetical protein